MPTSLKNLSGPRKRNVPTSQSASKTKPAETQESKNSPNSKVARLDASPAEAIIESNPVKAVPKKAAPKKPRRKSPARKKPPAKTVTPKPSKKPQASAKKPARKTKKKSS